MKLTQPGSRAVVQSKGFVPVAQENGMLIAYATAEGELASDVGSGSGPYAKALAEEIVKPGIEAVVMFRTVQRRVRAAIRQEPYLGFSALGDVYLAGKDAKPPQPAAIQARLSEAAEAWDRAKDMTSVAVLELFITRYKDTFYADMAKVRIEELKRQQVAAASPTAAGTTPAKQPITSLERPGIASHAPAPQRPAPAERPAIAITPAPLTAECDGGVWMSIGNQRRCLKPKDSFRDCPNCPEMVVVPAGSFTMGSPVNELGRASWEEQVRVSISAPFAVGRFAVTFDEWDACTADGGCNGYRPADQGWGRDKHPVINVNWDDAKAYTAWVSRKTGKSYRLLSEAEREYVTRAGTTTPFSWGSTITPSQANYDGNAQPYKGGGSKGDYRHRTVQVDSFQPNPWGFYNVHGNVWEWTEDCWSESNASYSNDGGRPRTTGDCTRRAVRGGSWYDNPQDLRSAYRSGWTAVVRDYLRGFRVARTLNP